MTSLPQNSSKVAASVIAWLVIATLVGASGALQSVRPPAPQVLIVGLTIVLILLGVFLPALRKWLATVDLRIIVGLHLSRFVGFYFLFLYRRGELPYNFAVLGGWGDIAVASLALILLICVNPSTDGGRRLYLGWNMLGLIDILGVVTAAASEGSARPESMRPLLHLPLSLLATFLVPLIIASHFLIFARLIRKPVYPAKPLTA